MKSTAAFVALLSVVAATLPAFAADSGKNASRRPKPHFVVLEEAYETERLSLSVGTDGTGTVRVPRACAGCSDALLNVTAATRLLVQGKPRPLRELGRMENRGATVFAKAKTDQVVRIEVY
jgi:hypothetical protein